MATVMKITELSLAIGILVTTVLGMPVIDKGSIWEHLGPNECWNPFRKWNETCGYLQFCSTNGLDQGCRNCSEIYKHWCRGDLEEFRRRYPTCEILCESKFSLCLSVSLCLSRSVSPCLSVSLCQLSCDTPLPPFFSLSLSLDFSLCMITFVLNIHFLLDAFVLVVRIQWYDFI